MILPACQAYILLDLVTVIVGFAMIRVKIARTRLEQFVDVQLGKGIAVQYLELPYKNCDVRVPDGKTTMSSGPMCVLANAHQSSSGLDWKHYGKIQRHRKAFISGFHGTFEEKGVDAHQRVQDVFGKMLNDGIPYPRR